MCLFYGVFHLKLPRLLVSKVQLQPDQEWILHHPLSFLLETLLQEGWGCLKGLGGPQVW